MCQLGFRRLRAMFQKFAAIFELLHRLLQLLDQFSEILIILSLRRLIYRHYKHCLRTQVNREGLRALETTHNLLNNKRRPKTLNKRKKSKEKIQVEREEQQRGKNNTTRNKHTLIEDKAKDKAKRVFFLMFEFDRPSELPSFDLKKKPGRRPPT